MNYSDVKKSFETIDPAQLGPKNEQQYRFHLLQLMFEIYGCLDSLSHSYRELLKLQQAREKKNGGGQ